MTQASFPFEGLDTTETQFSKWARHFNSGVDDVPTGTDLSVSAGTGLAVDVEAGEAMVRGHYYTSDATESLALATADASNDRIDTVVLRLDPTANSIVLAVKTGTPDAAPTAPALVQTDAGIFEQALANVLVAATSGVPGTITDRREFMGTRLGSWSTAGRPDPAGRVLFGFNTDTETIEFYNTETPGWQDVTPASIGDIGDVTITGTPGDGELLAYDSGTSEWVNQALETSQLPTGTILQVVSTTKTNSFSASIAAGASTLITDLSASITPSSTSSKIFCIVDVGAANDGATLMGFGLQLKRGGTLIGAGGDSGSKPQVNAAYKTNTGDSNSFATAGFNFLDSPATTSATTYEVFLLGNDTTTKTYFVNRTNSDSDDGRGVRTSSTITLMEVAG